MGRAVSTEISEAKMNQALSIEVPSNVAELVSQEAFGAYTLKGASAGAKSKLSQLTVDSLFPTGISDSEMADCCLSGLWLLHNFLDPSHDISQEIHTCEGSFWHAIMHRLEGDYWNSKYWYRKVGSHPAFQDVEPNWDPEHFVDRCESTGKENSEVQSMAVAEWKALFEYCYTNAAR